MEPTDYCLKQREPRVSCSPQAGVPEVRHVRLGEGVREQPGQRAQHHQGSPGGGCRRLRCCCPEVVCPNACCCPRMYGASPSFFLFTTLSYLLLPLSAASDPSDADSLRPRQGRRRRLHVQGGPRGQEASRRGHLQVRKNLFSNVSLVLVALPSLRLGVTLSKNLLDEVILRFDLPATKPKSRLFHFCCRVSRVCSVVAVARSASHRPRPPWFYTLTAFFSAVVACVKGCGRWLRPTTALAP